MCPGKYDSDLARAKAICDETRTKNTDKEFRELYADYHRYLETFASKRLYDRSRLRDVLQDYWLSIWEGAVCHYNGQSSLKTYLSSILYNKIKTINEKYHNIDSKDNVKNNKFLKNDVMAKDAEKHDREKSIKILVNKALLILADTRPEDAYLIGFRNKGLTYEEIVKKGTKGQISGAQLAREIDRLKQRYSRALLKLKIILERLLEAENMKLSDYLEERE